MKTLAFVLAFSSTSAAALAAGGAFTRNGDLNLDGSLDLSDAIRLLGYLFLGESPPVEIECAPCDSCCPEVAKLLATGITRCVDPENGKVLDRCPREGEPGFGQDGYYQAGATRRGQYEVVTFGDPDQKKWVTVDYATGLMWEYYGSWGGWGSYSYCEGLSEGGFDDWRMPNVFESLTLMLYPARYSGSFPRLWGPLAMDFDAFLRVKVSSATSTNDVHFGELYGIDFHTGEVELGPGSGRPGFRCVRSIGPGDLKALGLPEPWERVRAPGRNGDLNADGSVDLNDVIFLLQHLYLSGTAPVEVSCPGCDTCCPDFPARPVVTGANRCVKDPFSTRPCGDPTAPGFGQDGDYQLGLPRLFWVEDRGSADPREWVTVDAVLGLMWQYEMPPEMTWANALAYCEELTLDGFDDWRMPNVFEFMSVFNFGRDPPTYTEYFSWPDPDGYYLHWTSTPINQIPTDFPIWNEPRKLAEVGLSYYVRIWALQAFSIEKWTSRVRAVRTLKPGDVAQIRGH